MTERYCDQHEAVSEDSDVCVRCKEIFCPHCHKIVDYDPKSTRFDPYSHRDGTSCWLHQSNKIMKRD